jgi:hypothetical protein
VLAAEHLLGFAGLDLRRQLVERLAEVVPDGLASLGPLDEDVEVVELALQRVAELDVFLEPATALQQLLRVGLVFPEVRSGDALLYAGELDRGAGGVKDSSADRRRVATGLRICGADRRC